MIQLLCQFFALWWILWILEHDLMLTGLVNKECGSFFRCKIKSHLTNLLVSAISCHFIITTLMKSLHLMENLSSLPLAWRFYKFSVRFWFDTSSLFTKVVPELEPEQKCLHTYIFMIFLIFLINICHNPIENTARNCMYIYPAWKKTKKVLKTVNMFHQLETFK